MTEWIKLDPAQFNKIEHEPTQGADVEVFLSPYDVPEAVRGFYSNGQNIFTIEFRYIGGDEPLEEITQKDDIVFVVGRHSKRLYRIEKAMGASSEKTISLKLLFPHVDEVLSTLAQKTGAIKRTGNYKVAKEILHRKQELLPQRSAA